MRNFVKNKKKKGFTLIEMVAVVAIIGILAAILVPKITGYMNEAKKTGVIDQARKITQAYETAKMKGKDQIKDSSTNVLVGDKISTIKNPTMLSLLDITSSGNQIAVDLAKLCDKMDTTKVDIETCQKIVNGAEFTISGDKFEKLAP